MHASVSPHKKISPGHTHPVVLTSHHIFLYGPLKDNLQWHHYMNNGETAEHCVLVAKQEEQQHLPCKNRCSVQR